MKTVIHGNSVDHNELPHLDLLCLPSGLEFSTGMIQLVVIIFF